MPLTRDFRETVCEAVQQDPAFRRRLLMRGFALVRSAEEEDRAVGRSHLRDYVHATMGFQELGKALDKRPQSLMRMLGDKGNPRLSSFAELVDYLFDDEGIHFLDATG